MGTMNQLTVLTLLSLCCTSLASGTDDCHPKGPENCTILEKDYPFVKDTVCNWSLSSHFDFFYESCGSRHWFVGLSRGRQEGNLTSRTACSTGGETHCLKFYYKFEKENIIDLSVNIKYEGADGNETVMWIKSSSSGWDDGCVPLKTNRNFSVVFKAMRRHHSGKGLYTVFVDDISYYKSNLCKLKPHNAAPTLQVTQAPIIPSVSIISTTVTTGMTTTKETTTETPSNPNPAGTSVPIESEKSPNNVVVILSVIIVVLVVIIIIMAVLLVVFRGKHLQFLKTSCREKQSVEQFKLNASQNAAYRLDADDPGQTNVVSNATQQNPDNHITSPQTSSNHSPEKPPTNNHSEPTYAVANKPKYVKAGNSPKSQSNPNATSYELCDEDGMPCQKAAGTEYQNLPPRAAEQDQDGQGNSSTPVPTVSGDYSLAQPQNPNSVYHILEKESETDSNSVHHVLNTGEDGAYNSLNFDTKGCGETNCFDQENSEEATDGVYSHLNEVDEDTYNEVHREKRAEVIDGVYSHIK